jgi:hypothetical protein
MTTNNTIYKELARLEQERDAARGKLAEALATLSDVLSYYPKSAGLRSITPEHAAHVRRVMLDREPTIAKLYEWRKVLEELYR